MKQDIEFFSDLSINALPIRLYHLAHVPFDVYDYQFLFNDMDTVRLIRKGLTIGCFYIESPGMRSLLQRLDVETFEMLTAASSIIRPGVAESGMMQEFIARHKDPKRRQYLVPKLEEVLGDTYGVMIYQEDVIKVAHHVAGLTLEEADLLRRAMSGKMRSHKAMQILTHRFFESCKMRGLPDSAAKELWRQIESFAGYSFCKAHSASFALLSFQVAYLKAHYPAEFMACVLNNGGGFYSKAVYIQETKRLDITVLLPSINESSYEYTGKEKLMRIGLMAVKNLPSALGENIVAERTKHGKYVSLADFIVRVKPGIKETEMLIKCGAMDCLGQTRFTLFRMLDIYFNKLKIHDDSYYDLFMNEAFDLEKDVNTRKDFNDEQKCTAEYELFDYMVTKHPLNFFEEVNDPSIVKADKINNYHGRRVKMIGWYMTSKRISTKKGEIMKFLSLEDLTGTFEAVIFPRVYSQVAEKTVSMGPYVVEGRVDAQNNNNLIVEKLDLLSNSLIKADDMWDSAENHYTPNDEGLRAEDFAASHASVNIEQLRRAYAG